MTKHHNDLRDSDDANFTLIVKLLIRLHALTRDGLGDSERADEIRDDMELPWHMLTEAERTRIDGISADLSTLEPDPPIRHPETGGILSSTFAAAIRLARREGGFERILELLRDQPQYISADRAAFIRGWCYEHLGETDVSALFFEHAAQLDQANDLYAVFTDT